MKGRTIYLFWYLLFDTYCKLRLLLPFFVCTYVVIFRNKNMLKRNWSKNQQKPKIKALPAL